ncbi:MULTISPECIES: amidohydrolase [Halolamina]|uniref:5-methylthioadenosine/S-adenosylhomocysteine deaminase n=1 Tax=Halolamina pelagica TaxID=699431 RepID=A0A1I5PNA6_9EURY|nr:MULTISPECIES: amidohydrolase [Halolamina]NHX34891.1 amidohydrolase [Halolamina sp. R1-12]SFP35524.1 5-methylthioadenosine/S-adenosylhomocysteine deaminase [Halolamina pelagica]
MTTLHVTNGRVLRPDHSVTESDVLIDQSTGTIERVAPPGRIDATAEETLDAAGGLVVPGLINAHGHAAMTLLRGYADDKALDAWLQEDIWPVEAELTAEDVRVGTELAAVEMIRTGTTGFADMYFEEPHVAGVVEASGLRALLGHGFVSVGKDEDDAREDMKTSVNFADQYDGLAGGRIATAVMPHSLTTVNEELLREAVERAREAEVPVHIHANETEDEVDPIVDERGVRPLDYAEDVGLLEDGDFLAHCVHVDDAEVERLADSDATAVHCPASNAKLASGIAPVADMLDAGITVGLGTDGAASNNDLDMFDEIRDAAMLGKLGADDAAAVPAGAAVRMATEGSAAALGFDSGRIEAGANADLAVVDLDAAHLTPAHDLVSHLAYAASGQDVRHTVCDGQVLMEEREIRTLDAAAIRERAQEQAEDLVARAE